MHDHLVGYLCGALEPEEVQIVEQGLNRDQEFRRCLDKARQLLAMLECDREECCPPEGLAVRVCQMLMARRHQQPPTEGCA
jgi:anti-sigma-K factor RskA